jgi:O-antigen/teichoic acid export membrane protein
LRGQERILQDCGRRNAMGGVRSALFWSGLNRYVATVLGLITVAIVARLLTPEEIGLFAVASAVGMVTEALRDFGTSSYLIQADQMSRNEVRTTCTLALVLSLAMGGALVSGAPELASFYGDERLTAMLRVAAVGVVVGAFSGPALALLRRDMRFDRVAVVDLTGVAVGSVTTLAFIGLGFRYLSLALGPATAAVVSTVVAVRQCGGVWMYRPCLQHWRRIVAFGGYAAATSLLNVFYQMLPQLIIGRLAGLDAVALYSRAAALSALPERTVLSAFQPVILPALSAEARGGGNIKAAYLHALAMLTAVQWPVLLVLAVLARPVVDILLGPQWPAAAPIVSILSLGSLSLFLAPLTYPVLVCTGRVKDTLTSSLISLPLSAGVMAACLPFGLVPTAIGVAVAMPVQAGIAVWFIRRHVPFSSRDLVTATARSAVVAVCAAAGPVFAVLQAGWSMPPVIGLAAGVAAGIGWCGGLVLARHPLLPEVLAAAAVVLRRIRTAIEAVSARA